MAREDFKVQVENKDGWNNFILDLNNEVKTGKEKVVYDVA